MHLCVGSYGKSLKRLAPNRNEAFDIPLLQMGDSTNGTQVEMIQEKPMANRSLTRREFSRTSIVSLLSVLGSVAELLTVIGYASWPQVISLVE